MRWLRSRRTRRVGAALGAGLLVVVAGWAWAGSLLPASYSVMGMGYPDYGGGPADPATAAGMADMAHTAGAVSVADLTGPAAGAPDVAVELVARKETVTLASGERVSGYTLNHSSPGPTIRVTQGDLLQVTLVNAGVPDGVTLHWHGVDVPNAEDGVAGVTQDAVPVGGRFVYRFRVPDAGTYWYHSHQHSREQIPGGLFGTLIVTPRPASASATPTPAPTPAPAASGPDIVAALHTYGKLRTINGASGLSRADVPAGAQVRVRVIDTDSVVLGLTVSGAPFTVVAVDGSEVNQPTELTGTSVVVPAGGRVDIVFRVPTDGTAVRVDLGSTVALAVGPPGTAPAAAIALTGTLNLLRYGKPAPLGFDPAQADRHFSYHIGRRFGIVDGVPGRYWTVNGHLFPDVPMFEVSEGDTVVMTIVNDSGMVHPMHLHGHHAVVLSRDGVPANGSPWWVDSLDVENHSTYVIAFVADNPGIWMDHCHNLAHAGTGLISHLAYTGVSDPFMIGGTAHNHPS